MSRPRLFAELPAGLAAVSLRLHGGPHCRPPISRMGNKAGYAEVILAALSLRSGQGADRYLWAEADLDVAALLRCYPDADMLRRVAEIIRGWKDEEPRALWERLRAERKARGPRLDAEGTAGWVWVQRRSAHGKGDGYHGGNDTHKIEPDAPADACHRLAEYAYMGHYAHRQGEPDSGFSPHLTREYPRTETNHGNKPRTAEGVADRFEGMAREVAAASFLHQGSFQYKGPDAGIGRPEGMEAHDTHGAIRPVTAILADAFPRLAHGWPEVAVLTRIPEPADVAEWLGTPGDLEGAVVYMDPDYVGTTGYAHTFPRAEVVRIALAYAALGATVAVSEAVAIPELVEAGWHASDIAGGRKGQKRTFARVATEALTMSREPAHRVAVQGALVTVPNVAPVKREPPARPAEAPAKPAASTAVQARLFG